VFRPALRLTPFLEVSRVPETATRKPSIKPWSTTVQKKIELLYFVVTLAFEVNLDYRCN
jgi:hypothetical protein